MTIANIACSGAGSAVRWRAKRTARLLLLGIIASAVTCCVMVYAEDAPEPASTKGANLPAVTGRSSADRARRAVSERRFPWYDATNDTFRPLKPTKTVEPNVAPELLPAWIVKILMWTLLIVIVIVVIVALARAVMDLAPPALVTETEDDPSSFDSERLEALPKATHGVRDWLGEAARLAAKGLFGEAMVFYASWQLARLDQQGCLELQKGKTNRQYLREVDGTRPELCPLVGESLRLFEDAFFGHLPVAADDFERVWAQRHLFDRPANGGRR